MTKLTKRPSRIPFRLILLLIVAWGILTIRLSAPWFGIQDSYRVWVASAVRNYEYYGVENTTLLVTRDSDPVESDEEFYIYSHHPPLIAWIPALITQFTGFHELGVRYGFAVATLLSVCAMYVISRRLYNEKLAFWAAFFYAISPMVGYFGRVPGHDQLGLASALLFCAVLINWLKQPNRARFLALMLFAWLAVWTAWPAVFFIAMLGITAMLVTNLSGRIAIIGLGAWTIFAFVIMMIFYQQQWSESIDSILEAFVWRSSNEAGYSGSPEFTLSEFITKNTAHLVFFGTPSLALLSLWGIPAVRKHGSRFSNTILLGLFLSGLAYLLTFRNASYIHDYYKIVFIPSMAILAGSVIAYIRPDPRFRRWARPAADALIFSTVVLSALVIGISHSTGHQTKIRAIIDSLNSELSPSDSANVFLDSDAYGSNSGYSRVVEFYTFHTINWQIPYTDAIASAENAENRFIYIYCRNDENDFPEELLQYDSTPIHEQCNLYILNDS